MVFSTVEYILTSMEPTVDVVIPTFENIEMLKEAVDSCKNQSHPVSQILIIDDGSSEKIRKALEAEYDQDPAVRLFFIPHTGLPGVARDIGIQNSTAEWIAFLDSDDTWEPSKIELQLNLSAKSGAALIYTNGCTFGDNVERSLMYPHLPMKISFRRLAKLNIIINSSVLVRRAVFNDSMTYATSLRMRSEDYATWLRIRAGYKFAGLDLPLTNYRISETSIRKDNEHDPRIYALANFVMWSRERNRRTCSRFGLLRRIAFSEMRRSYE